MKVAEYIERIKEEAWDDEAERERTQIQAMIEIFKKIAPLIDKRINELKVKVDIGMASSTDEAEFNMYKDAFPLTLGDKNE